MHTGPTTLSLLQGGVHESASICSNSVDFEFRQVSKILYVSPSRGPTSGGTLTKIGLSGVKRELSIRCIFGEQESEGQFMNSLGKKLLFTVVFNSCLFVILFVGIQNSSNKRKVDLIIEETIELPISFIVGSSFILGSILGNILFLDKNND